MLEMLQLFQLVHNLIVILTLFLIILYEKFLYL